MLTLGGLVALFALLFAVNVASSQPGAAPGGSASPIASATSEPAPPASSGPATTATPSAAGSTLTATPSPSAEPTEETDYPDRVVYAGRTKDGSAALAVAVLNGRAAAYVCDGRRLESWLKGSVRGADEVALIGKQSSLAAVLHTSGHDRLVGTVEVGGRKLRFEIHVAKKPAGLYRARNSKTTIGWIVLPDGSQVGVSTNSSGSRPAPHLNPERPKVTGADEQLVPRPVTGDLDI
jgi:hypothetical protein